MRWNNLGLVYDCSGQGTWAKSHASLPTPELLDEDRIRLYFGARDSKGRSHINFVDLAAGNPAQVLRVGRSPILPLGRLGTFDDNGMMPSSLIRMDGRRWLYYIGWNPQVTVSYRLAIGLAVAEGSGDFVRYANGPLLDRSVEEPYFNTAPCVLKEGDLWRMWYVSCTGWKVISGWPEPMYNVKYAESRDGIHWVRAGVTCIDYDAFAEAIGRPSVFRLHGESKYRMVYSYRRLRGYRTSKLAAYRLGYAESVDGRVWRRMDRKVGIRSSTSGWDSVMIEYSSVIQLPNGETLMFYNGNGFGRTGVGCARLVEK